MQRHKLTTLPEIAALFAMCKVPVSLDAPNCRPTIVEQPTEHMKDDVMGFKANQFLLMLQVSRV